METPAEKTDDATYSLLIRCKEEVGDVFEDQSTDNGNKLPCLHCRMEFTSDVDLSQHLKYNCDVMNGTLVSNSECTTFSEPTAKCQPGRSDPSKWPSRQTSAPCKYCGKTFTRNDHLRTHIMRMHTLDKPFKCSECDKSYVRKSDLTEHARCHELEKPFPCSVCGRGFNRNGDLTRHMRMHLGDNRFKCEICEKEFRETANLNRHLRTHTHEKPFTCSICNKKFSDKSTLDRHSRIHSGDKPFKCPFCDYSSSQSPNLTTHIRTHTGSKPFTCDYCSRTFLTSSDKRRHMKIHTGEELCRCEVCDKTYLQQYSLDIHMRNHTGDRPWRCVICDFGFIHKISWSKHVKKHISDMETEIGDEVNENEQYKLALNMIKTRATENKGEHVEYDGAIDRGSGGRDENNADTPYSDIMDTESMTKKQTAEYKNTMDLLYGGSGSNMDADSDSKTERNVAGDFSMTDGETNELINYTDDSYDDRKEIRVDKQNVSDEKYMDISDHSPQAMYANVDDSNTRGNGNRNACVGYIINDSDCQTSTRFHENASGNIRKCLEINEEKIIANSYPNTKSIATNMDSGGNSSTGSTEHNFSIVKEQSAMIKETKTEIVFQNCNSHNKIEITKSDTNSISDSVSLSTKLFDNYQKAMGLQSNNKHVNNTNM